MAHLHTLNQSFSTFSSPKLFDAPRIPIENPVTLKVIRHSPRYPNLCRLDDTEARKLLTILGLDPNSKRKKAKFTYFQEFTMFLLQISSHHTLGFKRFEFDYSEKRIRFNLLYWAEQIVNILDAPNSVDKIQFFEQKEIDSFRDNPKVNSFKSCIGILDGTYLKIARPRHPAIQRRYYSWYKGSHCILFLVICDRLGRIRYVDTGVPPRAHSEIGSFCRADLFLADDLFLLGDGPFVSDSRCKVPFTYPQIDALEFDPFEQAKREKYNIELRKQRVLIEWIFGRIKTYFPIFDYRWKSAIHLLPVVFRAGCLLYNHLCRIRNEWMGVDQFNLSMFNADFPIQELDYLDRDIPVDPRWFEPEEY